MIWLPTCQRGLEFLAFVAAGPRRMGEASSATAHPIFTQARDHLAWCRFAAAARDECLVPHSRVRLGRPARDRARQQRSQLLVSRERPRERR